MVDASFFKRGILAFLLPAILLTTPVVGAFAASSIPSPTESFYVNDFANLLNSHTKNVIIHRSTDLERAMQTQVVVTTISSLNGVTIESYASQMFREYEIGTSATNNGILILCSLEDHEIQVEIGSSLEDVISNELIESLLVDSALPYLSEENWDEALCALYTGILSRLYDFYELTPPADWLVLEEPSEEVVEKYSRIADFAAIFLFVCVIAGYVTYKRHHRKD
jgi:uncharacterized protein